MITITQIPPADIQVTLSSSLSYSDIKQLKRALYARRRQGSIAHFLLAAAHGFRGWYAAGPWWSDLTLITASDCRRAFGRIALVGTPRWRIWLQTFAGALACEEIKFFTHEDYSEARDWLVSRRDEPRLLPH